MEIFSSDNGRRFRRISLLMSAFSLVFGGIAIAQSQSFSVPNSLAVASITATLCFVVFGLSASQTAEHLTRLRKRLDSFHFMFDHLPQAILLFSNKKRLVYANKAYSDYYGIDRSILKRGLTEAELVAIRRAKGLPVLADSELISVELEVDGETVQSDVWRLQDGRHIQFEHITTSTDGWIAQHRDITAELKQHQEARETNRFLETVLQNVPSAIAVKNANTLRYEYVNRATLAMNAWHLNDVIGRRASHLFSADAAVKIDQRDQETLNLAAGEVFEKEEVIPKPGGGFRIMNSKRMVVCDFSGKPSKILLVLDDITERREAEQKVSFMASHDPLTGLKNRAWFNETIHNANSAENGDTPLVLVLLDLDGFKNVNDTFGHAAGDMTLAVFANKLRGASAKMPRLPGLVEMNSR